MSAASGLASGLASDLPPPQLVPGTVSGKVTWNGEPATDGQIQLIGKKPDGRGGIRHMSGGGVTDGNGAFSIRALPATYHLRVSMRNKAGVWMSLPAQGSITLGPNDKVERTFVIASRPLRIRAGSLGTVCCSLLALSPNDSGTPNRPSAPV